MDGAVVTGRCEEKRRRKRRGGGGGRGEGYFNVINTQHSTAQQSTTTAQPNKSINAPGRCEAVLVVRGEAQREDGGGASTVKGAVVRLKLRVHVALDDVVDEDVAAVAARCDR